MTRASKRRFRGPRGRSGPLVRGTSALSRSVAMIWRRSLQLRVVVLTLGLSALVIVILGFVLTSQITNRVLDVKVRAATEEVDRARVVVSGIVSGEEARSLDSSLQWARTTLISKTGQTSNAGLAGAFDAVLIATDHDAVDYARLVKAARLVVDTRNACARAGIASETIVKA